MTLTHFQAQKFSLAMFEALEDPEFGEEVTQRVNEFMK